MRTRTVIPACIALGGVLAGSPLAAETGTMPPQVSLITDRSGSSQACGPSAIKWGFMCPIAGRHGDTLYALNFTRPEGTPWDAMTPIEAPVSLWIGKPGASGRTVLLDGPKRTYQTPVLLLGPEGRANVFTLHPGDGTLCWYAAADASNTDFRRTDIEMGWGAYLGGAIDSRGRALLVYWANGQSDPGASGLGTINSGYKHSTIGYTLVDTRTGKTSNGIIDAPGAPYCYSHVVFNKSGAHVLTIRSEVKDTILCGTRNHYVDLRYYYSPDPASKKPWIQVPVYHNERACIQPLGLEMDRKGYLHLLYNYPEEGADGKIVPHKLVYAISQEPVSSTKPPVFVKQEVKSGGWDGRLMQTKAGQVYIVAYKTGPGAEWAQAPVHPGNTVGKWNTFAFSVAQCRIFPISTRNGSTLSADLEGVFLGAPSEPEKSSMFHFRLPVQNKSVASTAR